MDMMYTTPDEVMEARAAEEAALLPQFAAQHGLDYDDEDWPDDKRAEFLRQANALTEKWERRLAVVTK